MHELLINDYNLNITEACSVDGYPGFTDGEYSYFTTTVKEKEAFYIEQFILAHYLHEQGQTQIALPIQNKDEEWFTTKGDDHHIACRIEQNQTPNEISQGTALAMFHQSSQSFPNEPERISCFGLWKDLWIQKLEYYEELIPTLVSAVDNLIYERMMEAFPYLIGTTESAIQLLVECEAETRFATNDTPVICFIRYESQVLDKIIWPNDFVYDHYARDVAEMLRLEFLKDQDLQVTSENVRGLLASYEEIQPISIFAWQMIYARLLFPSHFYDLFDEIIESNKEKHASQLNQMIQRHHQYEQKLAQFYSIVGIDTIKNKMSTVDWLNA